MTANKPAQKHWRWIGWSVMASACLIIGLQFGARRDSPDGQGGANKQPDAPIKTQQAIQAPSELSLEIPPLPEPVLSFQSALKQLEAGNYRSALEKLYELHHSVQSEVPAAMIRDSIHKGISLNIKALQEAGQIHGLLSLYTFLIDQEPNNSAHHYKLAEAQLMMSQYQQAMQTLATLEFDAVFGPRAKHLLQRAKRKLEKQQQGEASSVKLHIRDQHFIVDALLNGIHPTRLLIDTGASICVLTPEAMERFELAKNNNQRQMVFLTANGAVKAPSINVHSLKISDHTRRNLRFGILDLNGMAGVDGLLGMNFLRHFRFSIDHEQSQMTLRTIESAP